MDKFQDIENYYCATKAYYLFLMGSFFGHDEWTEYILDKSYLCGAKVGFISNIMLSIKEDLVDKKEGLVYSSKLFISCLEDLVSEIAIKVDDGYKINNCIFPDAGTVVAVIRNKFAHGDYEIDFTHNRVIINYTDNKLVINIDKLMVFIMMAFLSFMTKKKTSKYVRDVTTFKIKSDNRTALIKSLSEVRGLIKNYHLVSFTLTTKNGGDVPDECIEALNKFLRYYDVNPELAIKSEIYIKLNKLIDDMDCSLSVKSSSIKNTEVIDDILEFSKNEILGVSNLDYVQQLSLIGYQVQRKLNSHYNVFNPMVANIKNLVLLDAITDCNSVNYNVIGDQLQKNGHSQVKINYDEIGMSLISMFNSLFVYPYDKIYTGAFGYKVDREEELDFSKLDLSKLNPSVLTIDYEPFNMARARYNSLLKQFNEVCGLIKKNNDNLINVTKNGNSYAIGVIRNIINNLENKKSILYGDLVLAEQELGKIHDDYDENMLYFKNKAIIEGIRNAIAHGNYEFISDNNVVNTKIIFSDIYEGKLTFKLEISFCELEEMLDNCFDVIANSFRESNNDNREINKILLL